VSRYTVPDPTWPEPVLDPKTIDDACANLKHTLALFDPAVDPDRMVLMATSNIYGRNVKTGLTMRDLRLIAEHLRLSS